MKSQITQAVAYYWVSTKKQGQSGLGLEVQRQSVCEYQRIFGIEIIREYIEIESGKKSDRKVLKQAIRYCRKTGSTLLFAKIDRLARNVLFVAMLIESKILIVAADKPLASTLDLLEDAIRAQREGEAISQRTKAALRAAKERGVKLGVNGKSLAINNKRLSDLFIVKMKPVVQALKAEGFNTLRSLAKELNRKRIPTYRRGSKWHASTVHKILNNRRDNFVASDDK